MEAFKTHTERLKKMYEENAFNQSLAPVMDFPEPGHCEVQAAVNPIFFHGGGIMHGSIIFRLLDDACTFAAWTYVFDKMCVTKSLHIHFQKPVFRGHLRAQGRVQEVNASVNEIYTEGVLLNEGIEVARCTAIIARISAQFRQMPEKV
ncbi:MAG: hypothetical protein OHK0053_12730 [Microscillaceae bacterium]